MNILKPRTGYYVHNWEYFMIKMQALLPVSCMFIKKLILLKLWVTMAILYLTIKYWKANNN